MSGDVSEEDVGVDNETSQHNSSDDQKSEADSSSDEGEDYTIEDLLAAKDIEKLTGSKLNIK